MMQMGAGPLRRPPEAIEPLTERTRIVVDFVCRKSAIVRSGRSAQRF